MSVAVSPSWQLDAETPGDIGAIRDLNRLAAGALDGVKGDLRYPAAFGLGEPASSPDQSSYS